jgi:hypothetical protein
MFRPAKATLGYPTQSAAIAALLGAGLTVKEVAARIGCSAQSVYVQQSKMRERARKAAGSAKASTSQVVWTPEKQAKARRLFGQSMVLIADALQVPPQEFLRMMLKGAQPQDDVLKALPAPSVAELSRDDDEAELAALEQEQQDEIQSDGTDSPDPMRELPRRRSSLPESRFDAPSPPPKTKRKRSRPQRPNRSQRRAPKD